MTGGHAEYLEQLTAGLRRVVATNQEGEVIALDLAMEETVRLLLERREVGKLFFIGNGGSAAIASHLHNDFCKALSFRALVLHEPPLLTAYCNDESYQVAFERQVDLWTDPGDGLIAISSSGASKNILHAVRKAREKEAFVVTFSGFSPNNPLRSQGQFNFYVPENVYGFVEVAHMALGHALIDGLMKRLKGHWLRKDTTGD